MQPSRLAGEVAIVTGASSGLGRHFADVLAAAGASVALMARRPDRLHAAVDAINGRGGNATAIALDVADAKTIAGALLLAQERLGSLSIIVNNAGIGGEGPALDLSIDSWDQTFDVNVRGVFFCAREAAKLMIGNKVAAAGRARIVNIASIASTHMLTGLSAYCASKAAVAMLTKSLASEWARQHIAVNALCPGYIETEMTEKWLASDSGQRRVSRFSRRRLMPKTALDEALLMLVGESARHITGTLLTVDDGQFL